MTVEHAPIHECSQAIVVHVKQGGGHTKKRSNNLMRKRLPMHQSSNAVRRHVAATRAENPL